MFVRLPCSLPKLWTIALVVLATAACGVACLAPLAEADDSPAAASSPAKTAASPVKASDGADWPLFRGDEHSTGVARSALPDKLSVLWRFRVKGGAFEGTPAIVGGVVYIGDLDGKLYALDLKNGRLIWEQQVDSGFIAAPAVRDGRVFIGDIDGRFYCYAAADGAPQWAFETDAEIDSSANFYKGNVLVGSQDATLYCLNAKDGKLVFKHAIEDQIRCTPTVVEGRAFVAGCDGRLHIIDLESGDEAASVEIDGPTGVTPAVRGDYVYFGTEGGSFFCIDWKRAKVAWTFRDESRGQAFRGSPAVTDAHVIVGGRSKRVYAIDPKSGEQQWRFAAKQRVDSSPVIVGSRAFVGSADGRLYALDVNSGKLVWEYEGGGGFTGSAAVAGGRLVIASDDGVVYCFGEKK